GDVGHGVGWEVHIEDAARIVEAIQKDPESFTVARFLNWSYRPSSAERAAWDMTELELNAKRKPGTKQVRLTRPWHPRQESAGVRLVAADSPERVAALERLKQYK